LRWALDGYDARLRFVDDQIKRLYEYLEGRGVNSNALWIIVSDHGEGLGNHNYDGHGKFVYEEQLRIPFIMYRTGSQVVPAVVDADVQTLDILPTVAEVLGVSLSKRAPFASGSSLAPFFNDLEFALPGPRFFLAQRRPRDSANHRQSWEGGDLYAFQDGRYKIIHHTDGDDELYDLDQDPFELENLNAANGTYSGAYFKNLRQELDALLKNRQRAVVEQEALEPETLEELKALGYL
jgi:arylsulfatase A-like enzyme